MTFHTGQLVEHPTFGVGKILGIAGPRLTVFFRDQDENPRLLSALQCPLAIAQSQSDPFLDHLAFDSDSTSSAAPWLSGHTAMRRFLAHFPEGFEDPDYISLERSYKDEARRKWNASLGKEAFRELLESREYDEITLRAKTVEKTAGLLSQQWEAVPLWQAVQTEDASEKFAEGLFNLIYGEDSYQMRFEGYLNLLMGLPQPGSSIVKWPIQTLFPFLAYPDEHLLLKPDKAQAAAQARHFDLKYKSEPNWRTYKAFLDFGKNLRQEISALRPRDMIDVYSLMYIVEDDYYAERLSQVKGN